MQQKNDKTQLLIKTFGKKIKDLRIKKYSASINKFAFENDLDKGNLSRLENGLTEVKLTTLWKIAQALGVSPKELLGSIEKELGKDFNLLED